MLKGLCDPFGMTGGGAPVAQGGVRAALRLFIATAPFSRSGTRGEGQAQQRFLLELVGFRRTRRRAGARRALNGAHLQTFALHQLADARHNEEVRAHVFRLFLDPHDFAGVGMLVDRSGDFRAQ